MGRIAYQQDHLHKNQRPRLIRGLICLGLTFILSGCVSDKERIARQTAAPLLARAHFATADGAILPVHTWWPQHSKPKAIIVALHGFNDYAMAFAGPGHYLKARGIGVIAYDQRGFGLSPGRGLWAGTQTYTADLAALVDQIHRRYPGVPVHVLGESMGGAIAMAAMTEPAPPDVASLILSAPAVWSRDMMPWYQRAILAFTASTLPELELTGSGLKIQASDNIDMLRGLGRDPWVIKSTRVDAIQGLTDLMDIAQARAGEIKIPVLVLYGEQDQIIPKPPIDAIIRKLSAARHPHLIIYPKGYHLLLRDLHANRPLADIVNWVLAADTRLPSSQETQQARIPPEPVATGKNRIDPALIPLVKDKQANLDRPG